MRDHSSELINFFSQLPNQLDVRVLVHVRFVDDVLRAICIPATKSVKVSEFHKKFSSPKA
jgi:hypothetical protein